MLRALSLWVFAGALGLGLGAPAARAGDSDVDAAPSASATSSAATPDSPPSDAAKSDAATSGVATSGAEASVAPPSASGPSGLGAQFAAGRVITGAIAHRIVHFTFDDGPDAQTTPRLLDLLDALDVKVTFFFSASRFRPGHKRNAHAAEIARDARRRGHTIGSHSVDHVRMHGLRPPRLRAQLDENARRFDEVFGARTWVFRPPFGSRNAALDRMLHERRFTTVMWNLGVADWVRRPPRALLRTFERVLERAEAREGQRGGVVLLHDTHDWSIDGFALMVKALRARNCAALAAEADGGEPQELYEIAPDLSPFFVPVGDAGPGTDAPLLRLPPETLAARQKAVRAAETARCGRATQAQPH